ncbi:hypothetical protein QR685DRAFT_569556 [Neurospora intermedia]|uniref:Extracellular membrane protein CFEM domain-containing protein n=1 Tax=Neurospora intermedia TaxID=5142 RepID=A0ABR3DLE6_NEUIN
MLSTTGQSTSAESFAQNQPRWAHNHSDLPSHPTTSTEIPYPTTNNTISISSNTTHPYHTSLICHTMIIKTTLPPSTITTTSTLAVTTTSITTPTPSASCTPGTCGTYTFTPCPSAPLGDCLCGLDPDGQAFCSLDDWCQNEIGCDTNAECLTPASGQTGEGFRCLVGSCCDNEVADDVQGGGSVVKRKGKCVKERGAVCLNEVVEAGLRLRGLGVYGMSRMGRLRRMADKIGGVRGLSNGGRW